MKKTLLTAWMIFVLSVGQASAMSFSGSFSIGEEVKFIDFTVSSLSNVTLSTSSYANGGFDPLLTLFHRGGDFIHDNDDGPGVAPDPLTGLASDALLTAVLDPGDYTVALSQFPNFYIGPDLPPGGFVGDLFPGSISGFFDFDGSPRGKFWAVDILIGTSTPVPEPASIMLLGLGLAGLGFLRRKLHA